MQENIESCKHHFIDSIFYEIELTAKCTQMLGRQAFEIYKIDISLEEVAILDTIITNPNICQRDIAKLILKDRANTGKLLESLENKGLIERKLDIKNNRPVKTAVITETGLKKFNEVSEKFRPHIEIVKDKIQNSDLNKLRDLLKEFREVLKNTLEIKI